MGRLIHRFGDTAYADQAPDTADLRRLASFNYN
jgi:hypothetical protein